MPSVTNRTTGFHDLFFEIYDLTDVDREIDFGNYFGFTIICKIYISSIDFFHVLRHTSGILKEEVKTSTYIS